MWQSHDNGDADNFYSLIENFDDCRIKNTIHRKVYAQSDKLS